MRTVLHAAVFGLALDALGRLAPPLPPGTYVQVPACWDAEGEAWEGFTKAGKVQYRLWREPRVLDAADRLRLLAVGEGWETFKGE